MLSEREGVAHAVTRAAASWPAVVSRVAAAGVVAFGLLVLLGWLLDVAVLKSVLPDWVTVKPNTALCFVASGAASWLARAERSFVWQRRAGACAALLVVAVGSLTLVEYLFGWDLGIDRMLFREPAGAVGTSSLGRMAISTAFGFVAVGLALLRLDARRVAWLGDALLVAASAVALANLVGYARRARPLYDIGTTTHMAVPTALALLALCLGTALARPRSRLGALLTGDGPGNALARRLLPAAIVLPVAAGWLESVGLRAGWFDPALGEALVLLALGASFAVLVWRTARSVNEGEAERRRAEEASRRSEDRYRALFVSSRDAIMTLAPPGWRFTSGNPAAVELFGARDEADFTSRAPWEYSPKLQPDGRASADMAAEMIETAMRRGSHFFEWVHQRLDGEPFPATVLLTRTELAGEALLQATVRDATASKRAESLIRGRLRLVQDASDRSLPELLDAALDELAVLSRSPVGFRYLVADDQATLSHPVWLAGAGRELRRRETASIELSTVPSWASAVRERRPVVREGGDGAPSSGGIVPREGQAPFARELVVPILRDGRVFALLGVADKRAPYTADDVEAATYLADLASTVAERMRRDAELARLAEVVEQSSESIFVTDPAGDILYVNPAFERVTGYRRSEALGRNPRLLKSGMHDAEHYRAMWDRLGRGEVWSGPLFNKRRDGSLFEVHAVISPVRNAAGTVASYVAVERDVSRERELERQVEHAQRMEAIGQLAGGVAHDFNNVLGVILGCADLAAQELRDGDPLKEDLEMISQAATRAAALTAQLLAFGRRQVLRPRALSLNDVASELEKMLRRALPEDVVLRLVLDPNLGTVEADPSQIEQVVMNLVLNARDAMPDGGNLTLETSNADLGDEHAAAHPHLTPGPYVRLAVTDTGCGMDAATQQRIFEPFFTTKGVGKGSGLGLATLHGIVKQSGGHIWVRSELGRGSTFEVHLPRVQSVPTHVAAQPAPTTAGRVATLLVVEDEQAVRQLAERILRAAGHTVLCAADAEEALRLCADHRDEIQLALLDVVMPKMRGPELAAKLATIRPDLQVLFMSGYTDGALARDGLLEAGTHLIAKPFSAAGLASKVQELLASAPHVEPRDRGPEPRAVVHELG